MYALSLAFAVNASAAAAIFLEVFGFAAGLEEPGFSGNGGGARSGSELSHLNVANAVVSFFIYCDFIRVLRTWGPRPDLNQRMTAGASA